MIFHLHVRKWLGRFRFALLFVVFTFVLYHGLLIVTRYLDPMPKYKEPGGAAVKAFRSEPDALAQNGLLKDRLKLFYWIGE